MSIIPVAPTRGAGADPWPAFYLGTGWVIGALASVLTFVGSWIYCVAHYGFLIGLCLGWIPASIASTIVFWVLFYGWGLIALVALIVALKMNQPAPTAGPATYDAPAASAATASAAAATAANAAAAAAYDVANRSPPPPSSTAIDRAVSDFKQAYSTHGMAAAVTATMTCYGNLRGAFTWDLWDYCAALDELGSLANQGVEYPNDFFSATAVRGRQAQAEVGSDYTVTGDRIAALKVIVGQAVQDRFNADAKAAMVAAHPPSFDCSKVTSDNLKLVCATPDLADVDQKMAAVYRDAVAATGMPAVLVQSQRAWLKQRNALPADQGQIAAFYAQRIAQALAALAPPTEAPPVRNPC